MRYIAITITLAFIASIAWLAAPYSIKQCKNVDQYAECSNTLVSQLRYNLISIIANGQPILLNLDISHDEKCDNPVNASGLTNPIVKHNHISPDKLCLRVKNRMDAEHVDNNSK